MGLSQRKAEYIHNVAELIAEGKLDLEDMKAEADAERITAKLDEVRGIALWTAESTMLRGNAAVGCVARGRFRHKTRHFNLLHWRQTD